jgi:cobalt/nickel transport system permease protein
MHMADALISPVIGGVMLGVTTITLAYSVKKVKNELDQKKIPLMGVMGAFIFAAQMINFSIPGTGSSGHLGGGMILSIILGPYAGFITMASVLIMQALFFADGGLLALGCNIFNLGFFTCFLAYPLIFKKIIGKEFTSKRIIIGSIIASITGLQLGAFSVVLETFFSGKTGLSFGTFLLLMQPIHLAIGIVEGLITASVISFIWKAKPEILENSLIDKPLANIPIKNILITFSILAVTGGCFFSWFASNNPDGLEWSITKSSSNTEQLSTDNVHRTLSEIQNSTAILPDYEFKTDTDKSNTTKTLSPINKGRSAAGLLGGIMTLVLAIAAGFIIKFFKMKKKGADL